MQEVRITPSEIREVWDRAMAGDFPFTATQRSALGGSVERWRQPIDSTGAKWQGAAGSEIQHMLHHGYDPEGDAPDLTMGDQEVGTTTMDLFEEDGDLIIEAALNGDDLMYVRWDTDEVKRGLTVRFNASFNCGTKAHVLRDYYAWILRIVDAAQMRGIAPSVEIFYDIKNLFGSDGKTTRLVIPVVEAGQLVDAVAWRAFIHGASFRTLGFAAIGIAGDRLSRRVQVGLGQSTGNRWAVEFADDVLTIVSPGHANEFPEDSMTAKVDAAMGALV